MCSVDCVGLIGCLALDGGFSPIAVLRGVYDPVPFWHWEGFSVYKSENLFSFLVTIDRSDAFSLKFSWVVIFNPLFLWQKSIFW